ncbi:hypothetical protein IFM89_037395 [Coptis chinensis]|uniref:Uncharacterized protein n=1 Tax=Coptis chinensis TaxID=261450 RepID=A0A835IJ94_9MAGN|nr:hypothetical protein IFM89_037395 [Coptis chinensis]
MDDSILIDEVGEQEEYGSVPESSAAPSVAFSSSVQPPEFEVEVEIVKPPYLGMCFETLEATKQFYIDYGKLFGYIYINGGARIWGRTNIIAILMGVVADIVKLGTAMGS